MKDNLKFKEKFGIASTHFKRYFLGVKSVLSRKSFVKWLCDEKHNVFDITEYGYFVFSTY